MPLHHDAEPRDLYEYSREKREPHCKCGNPDLPGSCPGWRNCPMCGDEPPCSKCDGNGFVEVYSQRPPAFEECPQCHNPDGLECP